MDAVKTVSARAVAGSVTDVVFGEILFTTDGGNKIMAITKEEMASSVYQ